MNPVNLLVFATIVLSAIALFFAVRWRVRQDRKDNSALNTRWSQLDSEVLAVSLLVSKSCPDSTAAHTAVINATKCLVFPNVGAHTIVSAAMVEERYNKGFEYLDTARKLVSDYGYLDMARKLADIQQGNTSAQS